MPKLRDIPEIRKAFPWHFGRETEGSQESSDFLNQEVEGGSYVFDCLLIRVRSDCNTWDTVAERSRNKWIIRDQVLANSFALKGIQPLTPEGVLFGVPDFAKLAIQSSPDKGDGNSFF